MRYVRGRTNLSATIFVPWDCENSCPFCTSKQDYKRISCDLEKVQKTISKIGKSPFFGEWVLTGGEPFANPESLKAVLVELEKYEKPVFINTTAPLSTFNDAVKIINTFGIIQGVNISRHIGYDFRNVASVKDMEQIKKPIRINTVISNGFTWRNFLDFVYKYGKKKRDINLRADYRNITYSSLKNRDYVLEKLSKEFDYISTESCLVCNTEYFSVDNEFLVSYHRGMQYSSVLYPKKVYINDILVKQDGGLYRDWDCIPDTNFESFMCGEVVLDG